MARKSNKAQVEFTESLQIVERDPATKEVLETRKMYIVKEPFTGSYNSRSFNVKRGESILLNEDEYLTYKRFLQE